LASTGDDAFPSKKGRILSKPPETEKGSTSDSMNLARQTGTPQRDFSSMDWASAAVGAMVLTGAGLCAAKETVAWGQALEPGTP
jgi:hypothetical protein